MHSILYTGAGGAVQGAEELLGQVEPAKSFNPGFHFPHPGPKGLHRNLRYPALTLMLRNA